MYYQRMYLYYVLATGVCCTAKVYITAVVYAERGHHRVILRCVTTCHVVDNRVKIMCYWLR